MKSTSNDTKVEDRTRLVLAVAEIGTLVLILTLAAYLRLAHNVANPGWYTDEGTHILIAQQLARGRIQYMAIGASTLLFAKLPLFELLLALLLRLGGEGMASLRLLTGTLGVVTVGTLYGVVRYVARDRILALLAALLLAIYPQAILYSRFGFSYNLLAPLVLLVLLGLGSYADQKARRDWLFVAALAIGLGGVSDLWMFSLVLPLVAVVLLRRWRDLAWSLPLVLLPFGLYALLMLLRYPQAFLFDLDYTFSRLSRISWPAQIRTLALNYTVLVSQSHWVALGLVGMSLLRPLHLRRLSLSLFLFPILAVGRTEALFNLSAYYVIPLLPLISLGVANLLRVGTPYAFRVVRDALLDLARRLPADQPGINPTAIHLLVPGLASLILLGVIFSPFIVATAHTAGQVRDGFDTIIDPFLVDARDARRAAVYVNAQTRTGDQVIASPALAWALEADTADFQMIIAFRGQGTPHLPANLPPERFVYPPDYRQAHFIVVDNLWYNWAIHNVVGLSQVLEELEHWPLAFESGAIRVYCNAQVRDCSAARAPAGS
jgi:4-amino-4-deoxy-L-arabinose transferase-like glycosyltransferase